MKNISLLSLLWPRLWMLFSHLAHVLAPQIAVLGFTSFGRSTEALLLQSKLFQVVFQRFLFWPIALLCYPSEDSFSPVVCWTKILSFFE